jgi:hypothetical protein
MATAKGRLQMMPEDKVAQLAGKEGVEVYKYTYDAPEGHMDPEQRVLVYQEICKLFDAGCRARAGASNEAIREAVLQTNDVYRTFQKLFPKVFAASTVRAVTPKVEKELEKARKLFMVYLVELWQGEGTQEEKAARAMTIATRACMRDTTEEDLKGPLSTRLEDHPEAASIPKLTPLDIHSVGGPAVHQKP